MWAIYFGKFKKIEKICEKLRKLRKFGEIYFGKFEFQKIWEN